VNIKQADVFANPGDGKWTRPQAFAEAASCVVEDGGGFRLSWKDGSTSYVNADAVSSYAIS